VHEELLMLALVLGVALVAGRLAERVGYPSILGEIVGGIIFGPPIIGLLARNEAIDVLGEFGVLLMMLYIGLHLDLSDLKRASLPGFLAAAGGFVVPMGLGIILMLWAGRTFLEALFVGLAMGVTSLLTKSRILVDLRILDTRIAHVLVAGALLSDVAVLLVFAAVVGPEAGSDPSVGLAVVTGLQALAFGLGVWLIGTQVLPRVKRLWAGRELNRGMVLVAIIVVGLGFAWAAELAGLHAILGAFAAGLFFDEGVIDRKVSREVQQRLQTLSVGVLAPFFFVSAGFEVSFGVFRTDLGLLLLVVVGATVGKLVGTALFYMLSGNGWREGLVVGAGMNGRGAVEIIVAELALAQGIIDRDVFSILVFMALLTTATVPVLLTVGVRWLRRRGELVRAGERKDALIIGAGPIARALAVELKPAMPVRLIDTNRAHQVQGRRDGLEVIPGSGLDELTLESANVNKAMRLVAATPNAETNVLIAQLGVDLGVPEISVLLQDADALTFSTQLKEFDISVIRAPADLADWEHAVHVGSARRETVEVEKGFQGTPPGEGPPWPNRPDAFPLTVMNSSERFPFTTSAELTPGDQVLLLVRPGDKAFPAKSQSPEEELAGS
jgi:Kef-type K+ transport system membrane component KefB